MSGKQHTIISYRLLGMLFLFFNIVWIAAPIIKATSEDQEAVSLRWMQNPNATSSEEENFVTTSYVNQLTYFSFKRQNTNHLHKKENYCSAGVVPSKCWKFSHSSSATFLLRPAYYAFLFRYQLF